jgi:hypothetical protein
MLPLPHLATRPLPVFPLAWDKRPATPHGWKDASSDPARLKEMMDEVASAPLLGVPTGEASGLDVLDVDPQGLGWLVENEPRMPLTRRHETRRGVHILFQHQPGLSCSASKIAPGVDVRSTGGYIVWWPAEGYTVLNADVIAPWPEWLLALIAKGRPRTGEATSSIHLSDDLGAMRAALAQHTKTVADDSKEGGYAYAALRNAFGDVASKRPPGRGTLLERKAFKIGGLTGAGWISAADVFELLMLACEENGLVRKDGRWMVERAVLRSLLNGVARPRHPILG